jgi:hypothetical protein
MKSSLSPSPILVASLMLFTVASAFSSTAIADEFAGKKLPASQLVSIDKIDHSPFDTLLKKYVDENGLVNYSAWHGNQQDRAALKTYLETLSSANLKLAAKKSAQLAYWINAYNALTIEGILRVYPTTSIRKHTAKLIGYNIWKDLWLYTGDTKYSLDGIEHQILRKMDEPRIHFAIVCASIGCPRLLNEAYMADKLDQQLTDNAKDFFSRSQNLQIDTRNSQLKLSAIMNWFGSDFGDTTPQQLQRISPWLPENAKSFVDRGGFSVTYLDYDWNLNTQK